MIRQERVTDEKGNLEKCMFSTHKIYGTDY